MTKGGQYLVVDGIVSLCKTFVSKRVATLIFSLYLYGSYTTSRRIPSTVAVDSKSNLSLRSPHFSDWFYFIYNDVCFRNISLEEESNPIFCKIEMPFSTFQT